MLEALVGWIELLHPCRQRWQNLLSAALFQHALGEVPRPVFRRFERVQQFLRRRVH